MKGLGAVFFLSIILACGGCGGEPPKPTKGSVLPVGKAVVPPAPKASSIAEERKVGPPSLLTYTYNPVGKTNPFKPLIVERAATSPQKIAEVVAEPGTPLEKMELSQLKLVAMIWRIANPKAMVEDRTGKGFIIAKGTPIGRNKGEVTDINATGVIVTEKVETPSGKMSTRQVTLKLYAD